MRLYFGHIEVFGIGRETLIITYKEISYKGMASSMEAGAYRHKTMARARKAPPYVHRRIEAQRRFQPSRDPSTGWNQRRT